MPRASRSASIAVWQQRGEGGDRREPQQLARDCTDRNRQQGGAVAANRPGYMVVRIGNTAVTAQTDEARWAELLRGASEDEHVVVVFQRPAVPLPPHASWLREEGFATQGMCARAAQRVGGSV